MATFTAHGCHLCPGLALAAVGGRDGLVDGVDLGSGRVVASETEAADTLADLV
jgi:hypothetical protein